MALTMICHVEYVAGSEAASVVVTCQRVEVPRGIRHRKRSRSNGHYCGLPGSNGATRDPSQEVEQSHGRYCGLPGSNGAARDPSQEVEQSRGHYCGLPGGPSLSAKVRSESSSL